MLISNIAFNVQLLLAQFIVDSYFADRLLLSCIVFNKI